MSLFSSDPTGEGPAAADVGHRELRHSQVEAHGNAGEEPVADERNNRGGEEGVKGHPFPNCMSSL